MINRENDKSLNLLNRFINTRSDSATEYEHAFENILVDTIKNIDYFRENPDLFGKSDLPNDPLRRGVIWALNDNHAPKTVILFGHHDTVDLSVYGDMDGLNPEVLKSQLKMARTNIPLEQFEGDWLFGRGSCDMKAGLVINLRQLEKATIESPGVNVLFLSVPDEETQSAGMRHAVSVLKTLKERFSLCYELAILTEPHEREHENEFRISTGSVGKMMPVIVTKGMPTHCGFAYSGLNAISITMEIVKAIELNVEMSDTVNQRMTAPPAFLNMYSIKETYDVTTPEFAVAYFNWLYLKGNLTGKFEQLKELCKWSMEDAINQFNYSYNEYLRKQAKPSYSECMNFEFEILLYEELVTRLKGTTDIEALFRQLRSENETMLPHAFTVLLIRHMIRLLDVPYPIVVIGLLPPFYPVVDSTSYYEEKLKDDFETCLAKQGLSYIKDNYFMGISDMSYLKKMRHDPRAALNQMPLYNLEYQLDFEGISDLDVSVIHIGPWGKDLHQRTERVYIKDVVSTVPNLIDCAFATVSKMK